MLTEQDLNPIRRLGFGLMRLPLLEGGSEDQIDIELMKKMTDLFMERGFTYYDTAYMYHRGMSERAFKVLSVHVINPPGLD